MRILYFSSRECWPLDTGARLRDYHLARGLAQRAELTYFGLVPPHETPSPHPPAEAGFRRYRIEVKPPNNSPLSLLRGILGPLPIGVLNNWSESIRQALLEVLREQGPFDSIQLEGMFLEPYLQIIASLPKPPAVLVDWHNIESEVMRRFAENTSHPLKKLYALRSAALMEQTELRLLRAARVNAVTSERERVFLGQLAGPGPAMEVIPNGVDTGWFAGCAGSPDQARDLLYVGSMDYHANIDAVVYFAQQIWPEIQRRHPDRRFVIAGRRPAPAVAALASQPGIVVTGTIDDVRPYYQQAAVLVVPLRVGGGTRLKILEAMAAGVPVISSTLGAEGIDAIEGRHWIEANDPAAWLKAIDGLLSNPERRQQLADEGRQLVCARYDWDMLAAELFTLHQRIAK